MLTSMSLSWAGLLLLHLTYSLTLLSDFFLGCKPGEHSTCLTVGITGQHSPDGNFGGNSDGTN